MLATQEFSQNSFQFYPNPTTGGINVPVALNTMQFEIFALDGMVVKRGNILANYIDLTLLPTSLYVVKIIDPEGIMNYESIIVIKR